jgi:hypothetical protein
LQDPRYPSAPSGAIARFGYFVLQTRTERQGETIRIAGVVENLATGEKQRFESADDLARVLREWGTVNP